MGLMEQKIGFPVVLNGDNYLLWSRTAKVVLKARGVWRTHVETPRICFGGEKFSTNQERTKWFNEDQEVLEALKGSLEEAVYAAHSECKTTYELWDGLEDVFGSCSYLNRIVGIMKELAYLQEGGRFSPLLEGKQRRLLAEKADLEALSQWSEEHPIMELILKINDPFVEPVYVLKVDALYNLHVVDTRKGEIVLSMRNESPTEETGCEVEPEDVQPNVCFKRSKEEEDTFMEDMEKTVNPKGEKENRGSSQEELVVVMNQEEDSCIGEVGQEAVQPKEVTDQEQDPSDEAPLMECSWEEDDWGHADPWDEMCLIKEDVCSSVGEPCKEEDLMKEKNWMKCPTPQPSNGGLPESTVATYYVSHTPKEEWTVEAEFVSHEEPLKPEEERKRSELQNQEKEPKNPRRNDDPVLKRFEVGEGRGKPPSKGGDRGNAPPSEGGYRGNKRTREEGDRGILTPTREGEGVEEGHESLDYFKLGGCYLNQPSLRGSVEIWETPWLIREGGSQEEEAPKLKEESKVISEPKKCSKSMCESNHAKLDLCDQRGSSLRVSVKTPHKDSKEGGQVTWSMDVTKEPKPNASKPKEDLGCVSESYHFKYGLCDPRRPYLRGSVEMTHIKPKEDVLGSQDEGDSLGAKVHDHEGRGPKEDDRGPKLGARVTIDDRGPKDGSKLILDGRGCMVGGLRSKETSQGISNLGQDGLRLKMKEPRWQSCHRGRPRNCGRSPSRLRKQGKRPRWTRTLGRRLNHQGRPRNKGEGRAIIAGLEELANRLSERSCGSDNDKCPRHLTEHKKMWLGQPRQVLKLKHSKDQQPRRKGSTKHVTKWLHHMNRYGSRKEAPQF